MQVRKGKEKMGEMLFSIMININIVKIGTSTTRQFSKHIQTTRGSHWRGVALWEVKTQ